MSLIPILGGIPMAAAVIDATSVPGSVSFDSNSGFSSVVRDSQGVFKLVLSRPIATTRMCILISAKAKNSSNKSSPAGSYIVTNSTTFAVITNDTNGYGNMDCDFSVAVYALAP